MNLTARYNEALRNIPSPGAGCHPAILGAANLGIISGIDPHQIHNDIGQAIPPGKRRIKDREIADAINKALSDHNGKTFTPTPRPKPVIQDGKATLKKIIDQGRISDEADLWEASPLRLWDEPKGDMVLLLETLYEPTDLIWIGDRHEPGVIEKTIRRADEWIDYYRDGGQTAPFIIPNPLTGLEGTTKEGKPSFRSDNTVQAYRFCLVEFDDLSREDQIRFWSVARLPVVCLIDSGGKSIHAWLVVQKRATVTTPEQWQTHIRTNLYDQLLTPLGVDSSCSNASRLSRLPGHHRTEKRNYQRLLWLSGREGRFIV